MKFNVNKCAHLRFCKVALDTTYSVGGSSAIVGRTECKDGNVTVIFTSNLSF